jgi:hypothetical protein
VRRLLGLLLTLPLAGPALAQPEGGFRLHRFDEDYSVLADPARRRDPLDAVKYIPLGFGKSTLGLGGELRERYEWTRNAGFGIGRRPGAPAEGQVLLQRLLLHADLRLDTHLRAFVQLGSLTGFGARGGALGATQDDRGDLVQAFADLSFQTRLGAMMVRAGRQELYFGSGRLVSEREGPNLRRAFDGVRGFVQQPGGLRLDGFVTRPVQPLRDAFDDRTNPGEAFWGLYATLPSGPGGFDLYWLGYERERASFADGTGFERRHTLGTRAFGRAGAWDWDIEAAGQFGSLGPAAIRAWTLASDIGMRIGGLPWAPRLGLKANIASGDDRRDDGRLGTFNPLYPKVPYFTEAGLVAPANLIDLFPSLRVQPLPQVTLEFGWDLLWRQTTRDAFYRPVPFAPLRGTAGGGSPWIGHQIQLSARWQLGRHLELRAWYVHFTAGGTILHAGGRDVDFVALSAAFKF